LADMTAIARDSSKAEIYPNVIIPGNLLPPFTSLI
jgi:hypothetical protein